MHTSTSLSDLEAFRCLELFSGIGGFAVVACRKGWRVVRAIDIDQNAARVYRRNFDHAHHVRTIESIPLDELASLDADLWWLSPPCQPFTRRGARRGLSDQRCEALLHVIRAISLIRPTMVALENVPGFASSSAAEQLREILAANGYEFAEQQLCPTQLGIPNRRLRYYLVATKATLGAPPQSQAVALRPLHQYLDCSPTDLQVPASEIAAFRSAIDCVSATNKLATAACFTSAYGKSPVQSGSYLRGRDGIRRFSPREILRLLGFPDEFQLCPNLSRRQQWKLVGNSLSIPAIQYCLTQLAP